MPIVAQGALIGEREAVSELKVLGLPFAKSPYPMWIWDLETLRLIEVNDAATQAYGYSRTEFLALTVLDIRPPEDRKKFIEHVDPEHRSGQTATAEKWRHRKKTGEILEVTITSWPLNFRGRRAELVLARNEDTHLGAIL